MVDVLVKNADKWLVINDDCEILKEFVFVYGPKDGQAF